MRIITPLENIENKIEKLSINNFEKIENIAW